MSKFAISFGLAFIMSGCAAVSAVPEDQTSVQTQMEPQTSPAETKAGQVLLDGIDPIDLSEFQPENHPDDHGEPTPYDPDADAWADLNAALNRAIDRDVYTLVVMGANWCHDSRALAAHFEKPRFQSLISNNYELVYIDVGEKNRNVDIAQSFGVDRIVGTPTVFIVDTDRTVINAETAKTWRNAASRTEDDIFDYFQIGDGRAGRISKP